MNDDANRQMNPPMNPNDQQAQQQQNPHDLNGMANGSVPTSLPPIPQIQGSMPLPSFRPVPQPQRISVGSPETGYTIPDRSAAGNRSESQAEQGDSPLKESQGETAPEKSVETSTEKAPEIAREYLKEIEAKDLPQQQLQPQAPVTTAPADPVVKEPETEIKLPNITGYPVPEVKNHAEIRALGEGKGPNSANLALSIFLEKLLQQEASDNQS